MRLRFIKDYKLIRPNRKDKTIPAGTIIFLGGKLGEKALKSGAAELATPADKKAVDRFLKKLKEE